MVLKLYKGIPLLTFNAEKLYKKIMQMFHLQIEYEKVNVENMVQICFFFQSYNIYMSRFLMLRKNISKIKKLLF